MPGPDDAVFVPYSGLSRHGAINSSRVRVGSVTRSIPTSRHSALVCVITESDLNARF